MKKALAAVFTVFTVTLCVLLRGGLIASIAASVPIAPARAEAADDSLEQQIVAKEREGLDALKAGDLTLFGNLTADDAVFVDSRGPAGKAQVMSNVAGFRITEYTMADVKYLRISRDSGLISYKITEKGGFTRQGICRSGLRFFDLGETRRQVGLPLQSRDGGKVTA